VNRYPEQQNMYKRGYYDASGVLDDYTTQSWGEKFASGQTMYDNIGDFFQNATAWDNSVSISGGSKNNSYFASASRYDQKGIIPNTGYRKNTFRLNGDQKYGNLTVGANVAYSQAFTDKTLTSAGLWGSGGTGSMNSVYRWARNDDMTHYLNDDGTKYRMFEGRQNLEDDVENPYWIINKNKMTDFTERVTGNINFDLKLTDWWNISYRAGVDSYTTSNSNLIYPGGAIQYIWQDGMMSENDLKYQYLSSNLMTNFNKKFGDFDLNLLLGTITEDTKTTSNRRMGYGFSEEGFFSFPNIVDAQKFFTENHTRKRKIGVYGEFRAAYKNYAYLTVTARNDWTSTLPEANNSYLYPSVSGSFVFSELLPKNDIVYFGKIRASWARVGKDTDSYKTNTYLWPSQQGLGGLVSVGNSWSRGNPYLRPETTESIELGLDMRFLQGRVGFEFTYYNNNSYDHILEPRLGQSTGYIFCAVNAGDTYNKGFEISITGTPVKTKDFTWEATINASQNKGTVDNLLKGMEILYVTSVQVGNAKSASFNGGNFLGISGSKWTRVDDAIKKLNLKPEDESAMLNTLKSFNLDGSVILDQYGMPTSDNLTTYEIGNREPTLLGGFNNNFRYKNWSLNVLLDFRIGGDVYNGTDYWMTLNGMAKRTINRDKLVLTGLVQTGTTPGTDKNGNAVQIPEYEEQTFTFEANGTYNMSGTPTSGRRVIQNYWTTYYARESANFMTKTHWLRLRTISLSYSLPKSLLDKSKFIKGCVFTVSGNNLLLLTNYKGMDPETSAGGSGTGGSSGIGIDYCGVPATAGMSFGLSLTF
jgi:TonB-linked SusC/RagA family outer membrane protein